MYDAKRGARWILPALLVAVSWRRSTGGNVRVLATFLAVLVGMVFAYTVLVHVLVWSIVVQVAPLSSV